MTLFFRYVFFIMGVLCCAAKPLRCAQGHYSDPMWGLGDMDDLFNSTDIEGSFGLVCDDGGDEDFMIPDDLLDCHGLYEFEGPLSVSQSQSTQTPLSSQKEDATGSLERKGASDVVGCSIQGLSVMWRDTRTKIVESERVKKLREVLTKKSVKFVDVRDSDYKLASNADFELDILNLMHAGEDIQKVEDGRYHCFGQLSQSDMPCESVIIAMFKQLCTFPKSLFELKFELYRQNYRMYAPSFLADLEIAFAVGGVHPCDRQILSRNGQDLCIEMRDVWEVGKDLTSTDLAKYLKKLPGKYAYISKNPRYTRALQRLWDMQKCGGLDLLRSLKADLPPGLRDKTRSHAATKVRKNNMSRILPILSLHLNEEVALEKLLAMVTLPHEVLPGRAWFLRVLLSLALSGHPIVYDKEKQTVQFLDKSPPILSPLENTNLLTLVYDLVQRYESRLIPFEIGYYAYRLGYWPNGWGRARFFSEIHWYKSALAIMGYIDIYCCARNCRDDVACQKFIWSEFAKDGVVQSFDDYKKTCAGVIPSDLDVIRRIESLRESADFAVFYNYAETQRKARASAVSWCVQFVEKTLPFEPFTTEAFMRVCASCGLQTVPEMWNVAGVLTSRKDGGRLCYRPEMSDFVWDNTGCPSPEKDDFVASVFTLNYDIPHIPAYVLMHMLKQHGFQDVQSLDVYDVLHGLSVLSLNFLHEKPLTQERKAVNLLLTPGADIKPDLDDNGRITWPWKIAYMIVRWVRDGSMVKLWQAYLNTQEDPPQRKRRRLPVISGSPEDIIRPEMPMLYAFLENRPVCK